jgi:TolB protein
MKKIILIALIILSFPFNSHAVLKIDITRGNADPIRVATPNFIGGQLANDITGVIENDLRNSGLFALIDKGSYIQKIDSVDTAPDFPSWKNIRAQALLTGTVVETGANVTVQFRLWDVLAQKQSTAKSFTTSKKGWRRAAHLVADEIYKHLTGESGYFDSRIVYVAESGDWRRKTKRLAIMDQDGENLIYLTSGRSLVLTPRFDPNSQRIIYLSYQSGKPSVYLYNLSTGREEILGKFPGMSYAPRFSHDGSKIGFSITENGNSDIYIMDVGSRRVQKITNDPAIDTSPSFSPDGSRIVFNSDRDGKQQLYVMNSDGGSVKRISFGDGRYGTPVWSPRGDLIAFTKMDDGQFYIGVMNPDGSGERLLTASYLDEGPTWAPNGRVIMFTRKERDSDSAQGKSYIYSVDITGYNLRRAQTETEASDPAWSPLLSKQ